MPATTAKPSHVSTNEAARMLGISPQTLRANLCRSGHYFGIRPRKMPNRLLLWPVAEILAAGGASA